MAIPPSPGQPALLRQLNDRAALMLLLEAGPLTRNELATRTGLSKPTAAEIIRRLEECELIRESGTRQARRGPSAAVYEVITENDLGVAIDIQHDRILSGVVDAAQRVHPIADRPLIRGDSTDAATLVTRAIQDAADAAGLEPDNVVSVCIGVQASVDHTTDSLSFSDDLTGWPTTQVSSGLAAEVGVRVTLENDANLAAIAERAAPVEHPLRSFALLWLAEGLGMALVIDGKVHSGASGAAGEVGYLNVPATALAIDESAKSVADLIDDAAIVRLAREHGISFIGDDDSSWRTVLRVIDALDERHPFFAALGERIGYNVLPALAVADPEAVILHGPTGVAGGTALASATTSWLRTRTRWVTPVVPARVPSNAVLSGARAVLVDEIRQALADRLVAVSDSLDSAPSPQN